MTVPRQYRYVGPDSLLEVAAPAAPVALSSGTFTFVVDLDGVLVLAPRRSEHVACAGGRDVLAAGEITLRSTADGSQADMVSNQSTGYCPDLTSWESVAGALDRLGIVHPGRFTHPIVFRLCPECRQRNIVREGVFVCALCDADLPEHWNFDDQR